MLRRIHWIRTRLPLALSSLMLIGLAACGGGGGGGGGSGGSGSSLSFSADKTSLTFNVNPGIQTPSQTITITASGTYTGTIYVAATASAPGLAASIPITISGQTASAVVSADTSLPTGTYTGQLQLKACSDSACTQQIGNSPLTVSYTVNIHAPLATNPTSIVANATSGIGVTQAVTIQLPSGTTTSSATVTSGTPFTTLSNITASGFTVNLASLPSGIYTAAITVIAGSSSAVIPVSYSVTAPPGGDVPMSVSPTNLTLSEVESGTTTAFLGVTPPSWNPQVTATAEYPAGGPTGWLSASPTSGGFQVTASGSGLLAGSYTATLRVRGAYPATDLLVPVALTVGPDLIRPADIVLTMNAESTAALFTGSVAVNLATGPAVGWTATSSAPWLGFTKGTGTTGQSLTYQIDPTQAAALTNATQYPATVTVTPASASLSPVSFTVTLAKQLPEITSLAPYTQVAGQPARIVLRGTGFTGIANPKARVLIEGNTPSTATVVNDTEIVATFASLTAGQHTANISNALGLTTSTRSITAITPVTHPYAATPTGANIRTLVYDAEREAVFAANSDANTVLRYTPGSAGTWSATSVPFPVIGDIGLSIDGAKLFATTASTKNPGVVATLDPTTLATLQSVTQTSSIGPEFLQRSFGIATTNDGRTWLDLESATPPFSNLAYYTASNLTATVVTPTAFSTNFYDGPWFARSRDGERLLIVQSSSISPDPPMLYLNAADGVIQQNTAGLTFSYQMSLDDAGDRVVFDAATLRDGAFNVVGQLVLPPTDNYFAVNAQLSPDGSRIYALSYPNGTGATIPPPRVYVFDATAAQTNLPVLGYFTIADYPGCPITSGAPVCSNYNLAATISIDGQTLYYAGQQSFVVVPTSTPFAVASGVPTILKASTRRAPTPWPLRLR